MDRSTSGGMYEPPFARLTLQQHRTLHRANRHLKTFQRFETDAAHLRSELTLAELKAAAIEIVSLAEESLGRSPGQDGVDWVVEMDPLDGLAGVVVYQPDAIDHDAPPDLRFSSYERASADFVPPLDPSAWGSLVSPVADMLRPAFERETSRVAEREGRSTHRGDNIIDIGSWSKRRS